MSKKVLLIGHCGADSTYLRLAIRKAVPEVEILLANDTDEFNQILHDTPVDLIMFNRELGYGFASDQGVEMIRRLHPAHPQVRMMLVSNHADAQQAAVAAGALPGFGKRELGGPRVTELLRNALEIQSPRHAAS